ncbi:MAG: FAD-binding oxidoreductase [Nitrospirota bacterium]|jgi:D-lactate dehydrogenase (cytochrome)
METLTQPDAVSAYLADTSGLRDARCEAVVVPEAVDEIKEALALARSRRKAVTVSGAHTATTGAALPFGGLILSTRRLTTIHPIVPTAAGGQVRAEAGVQRCDVQAACDPHHLVFPPDPGEDKATIGGNLATHAAGKRGFHFGPLRRWVDGLVVYLASGERLDLRRGQYVADADATLRLTTATSRTLSVPLPTYRLPPVKHSAGYLGGAGLDAVDLFIGAEGTLGVIAEAALRLAPAPEETFFGLLFFPDEESSWQAVITLRERSRATPGPIDRRWGTTILEYFDAAAVDILRPALGTLPTGAAALMVEQFTTRADRAEHLDEWRAAAVDVGALDETTVWASTAVEKEALTALRYRIPTLMNATIERTGLSKVSCDMAVPDDRLLDYLTQARTVLRRGTIRTVGFGHIGDNHIHYNQLPETAAEHARAKEVYDELIDLALALGGTVSAEHGIGKLKRPYLEKMFGADGIAQMRRTKRALDPDGLLCPGNLFPEL